MNVNKLLKYRNKNIIFDKLLEKIFLKNGLFLPRTVKLGKGVLFPHNSVGTVIHPNSIIGNNVKIYQNVTIGRADVYKEINESKFKEVIIEDGAILCAGSKILGKEETLIVGEKTIIAANAVLTVSTGKNEIWGGIPAKKLKNRRE